MHSKQTFTLTVPFHAELGLTQNDLSSLAIEAGRIEHSGARALILGLLEGYDDSRDVDDAKKEFEDEKEGLEGSIKEARGYLEGADTALEKAFEAFRADTFDPLLNEFENDPRFEKLVEIARAKLHSLSVAVEEAACAIENAKGAL